MLICQQKNYLSEQVRNKGLLLSDIAKGCPIRPVGFVLYERSSGTVRFRVDADSEGNLPVDQVSSLLAMLCLVRGQTPADFDVMVITQAPLLRAAAERAEKLLTVGRAIAGKVKLSRREQDVLTGVLQNLANKEIAAKLNVSERTVKFHVSSLLAKFAVKGRMALRQEAIINHRPEDTPLDMTPVSELFGYPVRVRDGEVENAFAPAPSVPVSNAAGARRRVFSIIPPKSLAK